MRAPLHVTWVLFPGMIGRAVAIPHDCYAPRLAVAGVLDGGSLRIDGRDDGTEWNLLCAPITTPGVVVIKRRRFIRPRLDGAGSLASITLRLTAHRSAAA